MKEDFKIQLYERRFQSTPIIDIGTSIRAIHVAKLLMRRIDFWFYQQFVREQNFKMKDEKRVKDSEILKIRRVWNQSKAYKQEERELD